MDDDDDDDDVQNVVDKKTKQKKKSDIELQTINFVVKIKIFLSLFHSFHFKIPKKSLPFCSYFFSCLVDDNWCLDFSHLILYIWWSPPSSSSSLPMVKKKIKHFFYNSKNKLNWKKNWPFNNSIWSGNVFVCNWYITQGSSVYTLTHTHTCVPVHQKVWLFIFIFFFSERKFVHWTQ